MHYTPQVTIRRATREDLDQIFACECACFDNPWTLSMLYEEICENPTTIYLVMTAADRVVGYCGAHIVLDEAHITNVCVLPDYRGCGLAKRMMRALQEEARMHGASAMTLEVGVTNKAAQRLYRECGFSVQGIRRKYYNGREDAYIMWTSRNTLCPESAAL